MVLFRVFGIDIRINSILFPICMMAIYYNYFFEMIISILIIIVHEISHSLVSLYYGIKVVEIEIFAFGGVVKTNNFLEINPRNEIAIAIAGPIVNYIMFFLAIAAKHYTKTQFYLLDFFIIANLSIGAFNLLPILPLDGGRIVRAWLNLRIGFQKSTVFMVKASKVLSIILFLIGLYLGRQNSKYLFLGGISIFLFIKANQEKKQIGYALFYNIIMKRNELLKDGFMEIKHFVALESMNIYKVFRMFSTSSYHLITVINMKGNILGVFSENEIMDANIKYDKLTTLGDLIVLQEKKDKKK